MSNENGEIARLHSSFLLNATVCFVLLFACDGSVCAQAVTDAPEVAIEGVLESPVKSGETATEPKTAPNSNVAEPGVLTPSVSSSASLGRLTRDIRYLASDELAGRQPGTPEMELAVDYIVQQYRQAGVAGAAEEGDYMQPVPVDGSRTVDASTTRLVLSGPENETINPILNESFTCLVGRKPNSIEGDLFFAGYGIAADEHNYNEYRDVDVKGKVVVLIRREPQQNSAESVFDGEETSDHSFIVTKVRAARKAGAVGIILVNDAATAPSDEADSLLQSTQFGTVSFPFYQIKRSTLNEILSGSPLHSPTGKKISSLAQVENWIDERLEPISQTIKGWSVKANASFPKKEIRTSNLVAVIPGRGELANESVVVGAHYDHIGRGAYGSRTPWRKEIHNGADDNATGTAAVLELARRFGSRQLDDQPRRRLVLVCFTAEEMGLLGALHYVANPLFDLNATVAMVNFDMIGLLRERQLTVYNWNTSPEFMPLLSSVNEKFDLDLILPAAGFAGSDHLPFNQSQIPNMFIHTGVSETYHTPEDTFETINCEGVLEVVNFTEQIVEDLLTTDRPKYGKPKRFQLGLRIDREGDESGVAITKVLEDSVAESAGLLVGDVVVSIDGDRITKRRQLIRRVRRDTGKTINLKVRRQNEEIDFQIELKNPE